MIWLGVALWLAAGVVTVVVVATRRRMWPDIKEAAGVVLGLLIVIACFPAAIVGPKIDEWQFKRRRKRRQR